MPGAVPGAADGGAVPGAVGGDGVPLASAVSVELAAHRGWRGEHTLMLIAGLSLLVATLVPPLVSRRNGGAR